MKLLAGIAPGAGMTAGGRRLAVTSPQPGAAGDRAAAGARGAGRPRAARVIRCARSALEPQPPSTATTPITTTPRIILVIDTPPVAAARLATRARPPRA